MPITTPPERLADYGSDADHFQHVLESLFIPAVEKAGHEPIKPIFSGSDLIQAEIIKHLETADLVLCDMSILNANVFFELGIRTAVNKPVCLVRDGLTPDVPFDMSILVHHTYPIQLRPWNIEDEVEKLAVHLTKSVENSGGDNSLWKHFALATRAELPVLDDRESRLEQRLSEIQSMLRSQQDVQSGNQRYFDDADFHDTMANEVAFRILTGEAAQQAGNRVTGMQFDGRRVDITLARPAENDFNQRLVDLALRHGYWARFVGSNLDED